MKIIRMVLPNNQVVDYSLDAMLHIQAQQGAVYSVVDTASGAVIEQAVLTQQGETLLIEIDGEQIAEIDGFYSEGMQATVDMGSTAQQIATNDAAVESSDVVWEHATDAGAALDGVSTGVLLGLGAAVAGVAVVALNENDTIPAAPAAPADTTAPGAPVFTSSANVGSGDAVTGTAEANSVINLTLGVGNTLQITTDAAGNWTYTLVDADVVAMAGGAETLSATATDTAGNVSPAATQNANIVVDVVYNLTVAGNGAVTATDGSVAFAANVDYHIQIISDGANSVQGVGSGVTFSGGNTLGQGDTIAFVGTDGLSSSLQIAAGAAAAGLATRVQFTAPTRASAGVGAAFLGSSASSASFNNFAFILSAAGSAWHATASGSTRSIGSSSTNGGFSHLWIGGADFNPAGTGTAAGAVAFTFV